MTSAHTAEAIDYLAIMRLMQDWGLWRDTCQWTRLRAAFAPGATIRTTWFDGTAQAFVDASERMAAQPGPLVQHFIGATTAEIRGDRAIAQTRFTLLLRGRLGKTEVDVVCHGRFFDRLVRAGTRWLIQERVPIYEKDSLHGVTPGAAPALDPERLQRFPPGFRHLAYVQSNAGAEITQNLPGHDDDRQRALVAAGTDWLAAA